MLHVTHGKDFTRLHIFLYSILLFCITLFPYILELSGFIYLFGAIFIGLKYSTGSKIIIMDDDLQHPPENIKDIVAKLKEGNDFLKPVAQ